MNCKFVPKLIRFAFWPNHDFNRAFVTTGEQHLRLSVLENKLCPHDDVPTNVKMFDAASGSSGMLEGDRDLQNSNRVGQFEQETAKIENQGGSNLHGYDVSGNAHMTSAFTGHVPEPFAPNDGGNNLKEGMNEGLGGQQRWNMGSRIDNK